ncbi:hypothetical protein NEMBOFW57_001087 [Staphylotrichum longicolle]|uniref:Uncharacterized protein n=1 Tax=Staphylotrichum longicolle TaxID=669026 RepID=A0AAD4I0H8_9PEZI|nr:hypothetical protein NEMBOFW57_001087 [Staphylotrichum longicolle]
MNCVHWHSKNHANYGCPKLKAVARCRDHIAKRIFPCFPDNKYIKAARQALNHLVLERTGSGMPTGPFGTSWREASHLPHLPLSNRKFLMRDLNEHQPLDDAAIATYSRIMLPAMAAVVHGAYQVVQYLNNVGMELRIPPSLGISVKRYISGIVSVRGPQRSGKHNLSARP